MSTLSIPQADLAAAVTVYLDRQARRVHLSGTFDNAGRWHPDEDEWQSCCRAIRSPSRAYPYALMTHCRSVAHVAALYDVDTPALRRALRSMPRAVRLSTAEPTITSEQILAEAGIDEARQAEYQRRMSMLLAGRLVPA